ncbi:DUF6470 family protein [Bacillus sp. B-jedd]|uniref:DUF6470 family protein n=1 Tax=Bacillus sp. B-jedd TaxID=1476857 RepID=UPI00051554C5|nr:DUF6470 family protein [Bacillus sp. B-jedd]CEG25901.1 YviE [Bacillus sp. B-jedd]
MFPQIRISQVNAQIGLKRIDPVQEIQQIPAQLSMKQQPAKMSIERKAAILEINQDQARSDVNLKTRTDFLADVTAEARQAALEAIGQISMEGDQMAAIEQKGDALVSISADKGNPPPVETGIAFIPSPGAVKINYTPAELEIKWEQGGVETEFTPHKTIHNYTPGKTEVYLRQHQQLEIDFVGLNINSKS